MLNYLFSAKPDLTIIRQIYDNMCLPYMRDKVMESYWIKNRTESNPFLTKVVIGYWPESDVELRINTYSGKVSIPNVHGHRWSFYSMILNGNMKHVRYHYKNDSIHHFAEENFVSGDLFSLHEEELHTVTASNDLVTLLLRGPATRKMWNQYSLDGKLLKTFTDTSHRHEQKFLLDEQVNDCLIQIPERFLKQ